MRMPRVSLNTGVCFQAPNSMILRASLRNLVREILIPYLKLIQFPRPADLLRSLLDLPKILPDVLFYSVPYMLVVAAFAGFVLWNGGIVLGLHFLTILFVGLNPFHR